MLSKVVIPTYKTHASILLLRKLPSALTQARYVDMIPANQYDLKEFPKKFRIGYALKNYWELTPMFVCVGVALSLVFLSIFNAIKNKTDVVFSTHNRNTISRTMDLRNPTVHKLVVINQRYEPWPEMQKVLDKMALAEKRVLARAHTCSATA